MTSHGEGTEPLWVAAKGLLVHRCVLAAAGKWLTIGQARRTTSFCGVDESVFVAEARWMTRRLTDAITTEDEELGWALIDAGGPYWNAAYEDAVRFSDVERDRILDGLEELVVRIARAILDEAKRDRWVAILSEVADPYAMLSARTPKEQRAARSRVDLLVHRGHDRIPLVVDLKTGRRLPDVDALADVVADNYGHHVSKAIDDEVECRVLGASFTGALRWSDFVVVDMPTQTSAV